MEEIVKELLSEEGLVEYRMLSYDRSAYLRDHKDDLILPKAGIYISDGSRVWRGDLNLTLDADRLRRAAKKAGVDLYIMRHGSAKTVALYKLRRCVASVRGRSTWHIFLCAVTAAINKILIKIKIG